MNDSILTDRPAVSRPCDFGVLRALAAIALWLGLLALAAATTGCAAIGLATRPSTLGVPTDLAFAEASLARPGPIRFERVVAADWVVARSGLINLDHPRARAADLADGDEPIEIYFYVLEHPTAGDFIVDSGVAAAFAGDAGDAGVSALVETAMNVSALRVRVPMARWVASRPRPLSGVFLTHGHLDHVMGLPDVPVDVPVWVGPGETRARAFLNAFTRGTIDRMFGERDEIEEWVLPERAEVDEEDDAARASGIGLLDVFGDGSLFAMHVPGHTTGSMAFLVRSTDGPKLLVGDTSHTAWGWRNGVEPGAFTADHPANAARLASLRALAERHPALEIHLGHQRLDAD